VLNKKFLTLPIILILILVGACKALYNFSVLQSGEEILFDIVDADTKSVQFMLYDISVAKKGCKDSSCVTWELVRMADKTKATSDNKIKLPIKYGQIFSNMEIRQSAKPLSTGDYVVGATFAIIKHNKIVGSKIVSGSFKISTANSHFKLLN